MEEREFFDERPEKKMATLSYEISVNLPSCNEKAGSAPPFASPAKWAVRSIAPSA